MKKTSEVHFSLVKSLSWIVGSALLISGSAYSGINFYLQWQKKKEMDPANHLVAIVQTGPQKEALQTAYLAELMGLSVDRPANIYSFDCKLASQKLLSSPVIKEAKVEIIKPGKVYVDYTVRQPIAWLTDYENALIDEEGYFFPNAPFFSPKKLPEVYLGLECRYNEWNKPLQGKQVALILQLLKLLSEPTYRDYFSIARIDVSHAYAESYGVREIVLTTEEEIIKSSSVGEISFVMPYVLRLTTKQYAQELGNYLKLREQLLTQASASCSLVVQNIKQEGKIKMPSKIIDLRIPQLAFIE